MRETGGQTIQREAALLRALCDAGSRERREAIEMLAGYRWQGPDHQWIFEALTELGASGAAGLREELARRLTRKGFPDVDLESLFAPAAVARKAPQEFVRELLEEARRGGRRR